MRLSPESFVAKVSYGSPFSSTNVPERTSLCPLFWRFVLSLFIKWPVLSLLWVFLTAVSWALSFLVGMRPTWLKGDPTDFDAPAFVRYQRWPSIGAFRITPVWVFGAYLIWTYGPPVVVAVAAFLSVVLETEAFRLWCILMGPLTLLVLIRSALLSSGSLRNIGGRITTTSLYQLAAGRFNAAKSRVCPTVTFEALQPTTPARPD